jgi:transcriptional regulator with XRE-family HTH domain
MTKREPKAVAKDVGDQLKVAREKAKLTQAEVASAVGVNANWYARVERGEEMPSIENLQKIMKALKIKTLNITAPDEKH